MPQVPHRLSFLPSDLLVSDQNVAPRHLRKEGCLNFHPPPRSPKQGTTFRAVEPHPECQDYPPEPPFPPHRAQHLVISDRGRLGAVQEVERAKARTRIAQTRKPVRRRRWMQRYAAQSCLRCGTSTL